MPGQQGRPTLFPRERGNWMLPSIIVRKHLNRFPMGERSEELTRILCGDPEVRKSVGEEEIVKLEKAIEGQRQKRLARLAELAREEDDQ